MTKNGPYSTSRIQGYGSVSRPVAPRFTYASDTRPVSRMQARDGNRHSQGNSQRKYQGWAVGESRRRAQVRRKQPRNGSTRRRQSVVASATSARAQAILASSRG